MDWKLELVPVPVTDVDRAKTFYRDKVGFHADLDHRINEAMRIVQLTPPGSACSILLSTGVWDGPPGSIRGLHLVVPDIKAARAELVARSVEASPIQAFVDATWVTIEIPEGERAPRYSMCFFSDPDGNSWALQQAAGD
jgi:catechol 2,3-dioxygenase-like lactoylglutathione lyase family enzyme